MSMTYEEASQLTIGDHIKLDRNNQEFEITGIPPHAPQKITLLLVAEDGTHTFIDEKRLHLVSKVTTHKPEGLSSTDLVNQLTDQLHASVEIATKELAGDAPEALQTDLQEALEESVDSATEKISLEDRIETHFTEEPELKKPRGRGARKKGK